jgi:hypothetical protein
MQAGVVKQVRTQAVARAKRARAHVALLLPLIAAVVLAYAYRDQLFGLDLPIRIACVVALVILGWAFAMNLGRAIGPVLLRRLEPGMREAVTVQTRADPEIELEELDAGELIYRVRATPADSSDGPELARGGDSPRPSE